MNAVRFSVNLITIVYVCIIYGIPVRIECKIKQNINVLVYFERIFQRINNIVLYIYNMYKNKVYNKSR